MKWQKKYLVWIIVGIVAMLGIGATIYFFVTKNKSPKSTETKKQNKEERVQQLQQQLNRIKEELNKPENKAEKIKYFVDLNYLERDLNNFSQKNNQEQEEIIQKAKDFIKEVEKELKSKNEPISSTFKLNVSDSKIGYWLFESDKEQKIEVCITKDHPFLKGKKLDDTGDIPSFSIKFKKKDASKQEGNETYYFEKDNSNFELKPLGNWPDLTIKKELQISYIGEKEKSPIHFGGDNFVFSYLSEEKWVHIYEKHPQIKELLSQGKLKKDKKFIIRYLAEDWKTDKALFFKENNDDLEIIGT